MTIRDARARAKSFLGTAGAALDGDVILKSILGCDETALLFHGDRLLSEADEARFLDALEKRRRGLAVAYITGKREFYGYEFSVTQDVLIPKPDTEVLVERAVRELRRAALCHPELDSGARPLRVCDMCAGSGCIGVSVLKTLADAFPPERLPRFVLADISRVALDVAALNAKALLPPAVLPLVTFVESNLFEHVAGTFDTVLANPPYVPRDVTGSLLSDGRGEPRLALCGDVAEDGGVVPDGRGLCITKRLLPQIREHLASDGFFIVECSEDTARDVMSEAASLGFSSLEIIHDLEGRDRDVLGRA